METAKLHLALRNYLISNKIPLTFIDFDKSIVEAGADYQILVLKKPNSCAFEVEPLEWPYTAEKVLLYYNCSAEKVFFIPLDFSAKFAGRDTADKLNFSRYSSIRICEGHIMITAIGRELYGINRCSDIALLTDEGTLVSVWKMDNANGYETTIQDFHQVKHGYWLVNFEIDEEEEYKPKIKRLCLFSANESEVINLSLAEDWHPDIGSLPDLRTDQISNWFSEEVNNEPHFFVLAAHYQCCIYRRLKARGKNYDKIADITLQESFIDGIDVELTDEGITVKFDNGRTFVKSGSFHLSLKKGKV